jgi:Zn-dependent M28 family amino/carboxypeptidase
MTLNNLRRIVFLVLALAAAGSAYGQGSAFLATEAQIKADLETVPCKDKDRLEAVKALFAGAGAAETDIELKEYDNVTNLVVTKKGKGEGTVIVGAHYDKTADGCGALDNWSGIVILARLYNSIRSFDTQKTFVFVAFGKEEKGLIGSEAMAKEIAKPDRANYCAMVNFDSFGLAYPQSLRNISDKTLEAVAESVSEEMKIPFTSAGIENASSDSASFRKRDIPAITLHGLNNDWQKYLHSSADTIKSVNSQSVYIGYRHGLVVLSKIENQPCDAFRK